MWITTGGNPIAGQTITTADTPRSYLYRHQLEMHGATGHLNIPPQSLSTETEATSQGNSPTQPLVTTQQPCGRIMTRSQTGTCRPSGLLWKGDVVKTN